MAEPYNPLAKKNLGDSVAVALLRVEVRALSETAHLVGAGVYAIYYTGDFEAYQPIVARNAAQRFEQPIYVGKAVPKGARKGGLTFDAGIGTALRSRLRQHASSIKHTPTLKLDDFHYRALTVDDVWIPLGENVLIERFKPLWNRVVDGFGNKTPGAGRAESKRSSWDVLHPGRGWVAKLGLQPSLLSQQQILGQVTEFLSTQFAEPTEPAAPSSEELKQQQLF